MNLFPSFVPALTGLGDDQRELCATLVKRTVSDADGKQEVLFPEKLPA